MAVRRTRTTVRVSEDQGVFMISVAAELAEMHPQTLRMYEARGLIEPRRSPKGTRLYSHADVERLRRIQEMTAELGMNLAGVERVFELESELERMAQRLEEMERQAAEELDGPPADDPLSLDGIKDAARRPLTPIGSARPLEDELADLALDRGRDLTPREVSRR